MRLTAVQNECLLVFAGVVSILVLTSSGVDTSEGGYHYQIARQIVVEHALSFDAPRDGVFTRAANGRTYGTHEIGNTLFLIPVAVFNMAVERTLGHRLGPRRSDYVTGFVIALVPAVYCAATTALLYALLRSAFGKTPRNALTGALVFLFCSFVWTYSRNLYDGVLCMLLLVSAMLMLTLYRRTLDLRLFIVAITLLGLGAITRLTMLLALVATLAYLVSVFARDPRRLASLVAWGTAVLVPFACWQLYYNYLRTSNAFISPVQMSPGNALNGDLLTGLWGLVASPGKSVFIFAPVAVLSVLSFGRFRRSYPDEAVFVSTLSLSWLLVHARLVSWWGAWGWGPRHFLTIVPVLALPALVSWDGPRRSFAARVFGWTALAWGFLLGVSSVISNWHFRMWLAEIDRRDMIWSFNRGQAVDMIGAAAQNIRNVVNGVAPPVIPHYSAINTYASTSVNVWVNAAHREGVPAFLLAMVVVSLTAIAVWCLGFIRQRG